MRYRVLLNDLNENYMENNFPFAKRRIDSLRGNELRAEEVAKVLPNLEIAISQDRKFRRTVRDYLVSLRNAEKKTRDLPYMEAIIFHENKWESKLKYIILLAYFYVFL